MKYSIIWVYDGQSHLATDARANGYAPYHDGYTIDTVGNRTATSNVYGAFAYLYDADDELTNYANGGYVFGYNANGDMATATINGHASTFSYDYDDQLTSLSSSNSTVSYLYDALGRRIYRDDATGLAHTFIFDGGRLVAEHNESTQTWDTIYTYGYDLLDKQGTGGTEFPRYDGQGNTYQTLTASGSYVLSGDIMNDFGQHFGGVSGTNDLSYQWRASSGYRTEGDGPWTGSYNEPIVLVGARYYMPSMGVFLTRDTDLGQMPYQYCNADPVNSVDPSGHAPGDGLMNLSQYIPSSNSNNGQVPDSTSTMPPNSGATFSQGTTNATNSVTSPPINVQGGMVTITTQLPNQLGGTLSSGGLSVGGGYSFGGTGSSFTGTYGSGWQVGIATGNSPPTYTLSYNSPIQL